MKRRWIREADPKGRWVRFYRAVDTDSDIWIRRALVITPQIGPDAPLLLQFSHEWDSFERTGVWMTDDDYPEYMFDAHPDGRLVAHDDYPFEAVIEAQAIYERLKKRR